jgi:hypothetical protein
MRAPAPDLLYAEAKPRRCIDGDFFHPSIETCRNARENRRSQLGAIGFAVQLLVHGLGDPCPRRLCIGDEPPDHRIGQRRARVERDLFQRTLDVRALRLDAGNRLAEPPEPLEQPDNVGADPGRRTEIDDLDRDAAADPIEAPDALLHRRWAPRQVVEHEPLAELEVPPFPARFRRHEEARPVFRAEPRDLGIAPRLTPGRGGCDRARGAARWDLPQPEPHCRARRWRRQRPRAPAAASLQHPRVALNWCTEAAARPTRAWPGRPGPPETRRAATTAAA